MDQDVITRIDILEKKIDLMQKTLNSLNRYFLISTILTVVFFILPLIIALIAIPFMISTLNSSLGVGIEGLY